LAELKNGNKIIIGSDGTIYEKIKPIHGNSDVNAASSTQRRTTTSVQATLSEGAGEKNITSIHLHPPSTEGKYSAKQDAEFALTAAKTLIKAGVPGEVRCSPCFSVVPGKPSAYKFLTETNGKKFDTIDCSLLQVSQAKVADQPVGRGL